MTNLDLEAIRARANAATEGPWAPWFDLDGAPHMAGLLMVGNADGVIPDGEHGVGGVDINPIAHTYTPEDREFIAHARTDIPALLDLVDTHAKAVRNASGNYLRVLGECDRLAKQLATRNEQAVQHEINQIVERIGPCHCNTNPDTTEGPEEDCPQHGRPYSYWVSTVETLTNQLEEKAGALKLIRDTLRQLRAETATERDHLAAQIEAVRALHQPDSIHQGMCTACSDFGTDDVPTGALVSWPCPTRAALDGNTDG